VRRAEVADHRGVLGLQALERLAGTGAQVNDGVLVGDVDDPQWAPKSNQRSRPSMVRVSVVIVAPISLTSLEV